MRKTRKPVGKAELRLVEGCGSELQNPPDMNFVLFSIAERLLGVINRVKQDPGNRIKVGIAFEVVQLLEIVKRGLGIDDDGEFIDTLVATFLEGHPDLLPKLKLVAPAE